MIADSFPTGRARRTLRCHAGPDLAHPGHTWARTYRGNLKRITYRVVPQLVVGSTARPGSLQQFNPDRRLQLSRRSERYSTAFKPGLGIADAFNRSQATDQARVQPGGSSANGANADRKVPVRVQLAARLTATAIGAGSDAVSGLAIVRHAK